MIKCLLFDFDGVIAESVNIKTGAFRELFKNYPDHLDAITELHIKNGGMSRYDKFKLIYRNILKQELSQDRFNELCRRFNELVARKVVNVPYVAGAEELLNRCLSRFNMFVVSGTPEQEIKEIVKNRGLEKYFSGVFGSPASKTDLIRAVLEEGLYCPAEAIFIGDSINDLQAAKETGVRFIARLKSGDPDWLANEAVQGKFESMEGVFEYIERLN